MANRLNKIGPLMRLPEPHEYGHAATFPRIAAAIAVLPGASLVLDGEVCAFDQALVSPMRLLRDAEPGKIATPH